MDLRRTAIQLLIEDERRFRRTPSVSAAAIAEHTQELLSETLYRFGADAVHTLDGLLSATYQKPEDAIEAALDCMSLVRSAEWDPATGAPRIRLAVHLADSAVLSGKGSSPESLAAYRYLSAAHAGQVLVSDAVHGRVAAQRANAWDLVSLGLFRMAEGASPETLYQLNARGAAPEAFPVPNALLAFAPHLPATFGSFVGREQDMTRLRRLLTTDEARLVTLTGSGGIGKTRLAIETARSVTDHFSGAVWFVSLSELATPDQVPGEILRTLGADQDADVPPIDAVLQALPQSRCLLVLDNFDTLVPECSSLVRDLLARSENLHCLVTSRRRLDLSIEHELEVRPLVALDVLPNASSGTVRLLLITSASARLFVDRARQAKSEFEINESNAEAVAELCRRLDGIPLAIELAASWARMLTPADMLNRLESILVTHKQDVPRKHRSLTAAIEASYLLLEPDLQETFNLLSVFRGGWTLDAATFVSGDPDILGHLLKLQDSSLVLADENSDGYRGRMLEPLREYAAERLAAAGDAAAVHTRHSVFYAQFVEHASQQLQGPDQPAWLQRVETEFDNLKCALAVADSNVRLNTAANLEWFWRLRGRRREGLEWLKDALKSADDVSDETLLNARNIGGILAWTCGDFGLARAFLEPMLEFYETRGDDRGYAVALVNLANLFSHAGDYARARADYELSLTIWRRLGEIKPLATTLSNLGAVAHDQKDSSAAREYLAEALQLVDATDRYLKAQILQNLAETAFEDSDLKSVLNYSRESFALREEIDDHEAMWNLAFLMARVALQESRDSESACLFGVCEAVQKIGQVAAAPHTRSNSEMMLATLKVRLTATEFQISFDRGRTMAWDQILCTLRAAVNGLEIRDSPF